MCQLSILSISALVSVILQYHPFVVAKKHGKIFPSEVLCNGEDKRKCLKTRLAELHGNDRELWVL